MMKRRVGILGFCVAALLCSPAVLAQMRGDDSWQEQTDAKAGFQDEFNFAEDQQKSAQGSELPDASFLAENQLLAADDQSRLSPLELLYRERLEGQDVRQYGYDIFTSQSASLEISPMGAVQDSYVLGVGDELTVSFSGQRNSRETAKIDAKGMLFIEDFPPVMAAGLSMSQLRKAIEQAALGLHNTDVYVALSSMRQIGILVVGHVKQPGRKTLSAFHTVLDALSMAGGVAKDGSLRQIKLVRGTESRMIDLYDLLMQGALGQDMGLRDGDRIVVPPIGATVAITGSVKRPGIYEIQSDLFKGLMGQSKNRLSLRQMLALGGGVLSKGQNRFMHLETQENGYEVIEEISDETAPLFSDGAILKIERGKELKSAEIQLLGHTRKPGLYDLSKHKTLSSLLSDEQVLGENTYPLMGIIERWDPETLSNRLLSYSVRSVLKKKRDFDLQSGDKIYLFSKEEIFNLFEEDKKDTESIDNGDLSAISPAAGESYSHKSPAIQAFLKERAVVVRGAVRLPGRFPVSDDITLQDVLAAADGLANDADQSNIEITSVMQTEDQQQSKESSTDTESPSVKRQTVNLLAATPTAVTLRPGDAVRVMQKYRKVAEQGVLISGEVVNPGRYDVLPEDKLSDLIHRAGGLTPQAYPAGAVFSRESERKAEEARFRTAKQDVERQLAAALQKEKDTPDAAKIQMVRDLADALGSAKALGRITIEADPAKLAMEPQLDMLLQEGDRLYIPKRALTVRVSGEIFSPASLQFGEGKEALDYIREAGGFTYYADKSRVFVLYPNGSAQPLQVNTWNHKPIMIPPGSTVIVPRDPKPFDFLERAKDFTQILSNLAVTSILVDDLQD